MKITNAIRDEILENAMKASEIPGRRKTLVDDLKKFALEVYTFAVQPPKELLEIWGTSEGKSKFGPWLKTTMSIGISYDPGFCTYNFFNRPDDEYYAQFLSSTLTFDDPKLMAPHLGNVNIKGTPLEPGAVALSKYHIATNEKEKDLRTKLRGVLRSVNTKAQLLTVWPEAEKFLPASAKVEPKRELVDVKSILELNKALGITK